MDNLVAIADQLKPEGKVIDIQAFGNGNINDTFLVTLDAKAETHFILQRLNTQVFRQPELVMQNMRTFTEHVRDRLEHYPLSGDRHWEVPRVLLTQDEQDHWTDPAGSFWRAISFIDASQSFDTIQNIEHAKEVGYALGTFHSLINDLPPERLADTLEGFHITPRYLQHYEQVLAENRRVSKSTPVRSTRVHPQGGYPARGWLPEVDYCLQFVADRKVWAHVLETAKAKGKLPIRPIHGDPKINNVMIDTTTRQAISIVDLDTVKPGLVHYDIGDCLRSSCNPLGEETEQWQAVRFESDLCQAVLQGYLSQARFLSKNDYEYLYDAIRLITFELGLRFFTDYLAGNVYFKARHAQHNLARALVQFKLAQSIESQETAIRNLIQDLR